MKVIILSILSLRMIYRALKVIQIDSAALKKKKNLPQTCPPPPIVVVIAAASPRIALNVAAINSTYWKTSKATTHRHPKFIRNVCENSSEKIIYMRLIVWACTEKLPVSLYTRRCAFGQVFFLRRLHSAQRLGRPTSPRSNFSKGTWSADPPVKLNFRCVCTYFTS